MDNTRARRVSSPIRGVSPVEGKALHKGFKKGVARKPRRKPSVRVARLEDRRISRERFLRRKLG